MGKLYLIRHGQAMFGKNKEGYDRLSAIGIRQAQVLAVHLEKIGLCFEAVYCGTLARQQQTAQEVINHYQRAGIFIPEIVIDEGLDEFDAFNVWDHHVPELMRIDPSLLKDISRLSEDKEAFQRVFDKVVIRWISGKYDPPGCIKWLDFKNRVHQTLEQIAALHGVNERIALFTSGGVIASVVQYALDLADVKTIELIWRVYNASITRLKQGTKGLVLSGFNDVTFLELIKTESLLTLR